MIEINEENTPLPLQSTRLSIKAKSSSHERVFVLETSIDPLHLHHGLHIWHYACDNFLSSFTEVYYSWSAPPLSRWWRSQVFEMVSGKCHMQMIKCSMKAIVGWLSIFILSQIQPLIGNLFSSSIYTAEAQGTYHKVITILMWKNTL